MVNAVRIVEDFLQGFEGRGCQFRLRTESKRSQVDYRRSGYCTGAFVQRILKNAVVGVVSELNGYKEGKKIVIG